MSLGLLDFAALIAAPLMVLPIGPAVCLCMVAADTKPHRLDRFEIKPATWPPSPLNVERTARWLE